MNRWACACGGKDGKIPFVNVPTSAKSSGDASAGVQRDEKEETAGAKSGDTPSLQSPSLGLGHPSFRVACWTYITLYSQGALLI